ncbi:TetR/AcrR family transcriptional regulator [Sinosporangium siamense]|nr:TetR family transcriptional regulator [Sinosporangium siamense]
MRRTADEAAATRKALLHAALEVFAERGFNGASLADITARAGVTRGAAYHHFRDKSALYLSTLSELWDEATGRIWAELEGDAPPADRLRAFLVRFITEMEADPVVRRLLSVTILANEAVPVHDTGMADKRAATKEQTARLTTLFAESGLPLRPGVAPETAALTVISALNGVAITWLMDQSLFSPAAQAPTLAGTIVYGIAGA